VNRTTWAPAAGADLRAAIGDADAFDDRFPTQPIAVGRGQVGLVLDHRHPRAPDARPPRSTTLVVGAVVVAAVIGALGYLSWAASFPSAAPDGRPRSVPATGSETPGTAVPQADDDVPRHPPPRGDRNGALGEADGAVPGGVTVFDDEIPGVANLDPDLLGALRQAATDAAGDGITFHVNSGWRSPEYQDQLLREAIAEYGSEKEAARWVATADTSLHVFGDAIDIGPPDATAWLSRHGAGYGLCQIYRDEPWHYELRPEAVDRGCPRMYADPTHDPRMQQ
jgi:D-alanyl-D-alanine carboxypeptidase